jgi:transposase-like protein
MQCPECQSTHIRKNGKKKGKQNHICVDCGRQFIDCYDPPQGYSDEIKRECLKMYVNGMGFRALPSAPAKRVRTSQRRPSYNGDLLGQTSWAKLTRCLRARCDSRRWRTG